MKGTEWMGRYRLLVLELNRHANQSIGYMTERRTGKDRTLPSYQEWHVLEYIVDHPEGTENMRIIADELGISKSSLTKYTNDLCNLGYIRKYKNEGNKKCIILQPTEEGIALYTQAAEQMMFPHFEPFFSELDDIPQEYLDRFVNALIHHDQRRSS